jgi:hypothetical protein
LIILTGPNFNVSSNIGFLRKGGKDSFILRNETEEQVGEIIVKAKLDYLSVNTTFDLKFPIKDRIFPFISIGPRFDYLISCSHEFYQLNQINGLIKNEEPLLPFDLRIFQPGPGWSIRS